MRFKLDEYLNQFAWSQTQCAKEADVSVSVIGRVLRGETISRRNAEKLVKAIDAKLKAQGVRERITLDSVADLHISTLTRKRRAKIEQVPEAGS
jgi:ribosome-binding protein aMBF1 (putative translation factor)